MDWYTCTSCGQRFDEFEMNFRAAQVDKQCLCRACRNGQETVKELEADGGGGRGDGLGEGLGGREGLAEILSKPEGSRKAGPSIA